MNPKALIDKVKQFPLALFCGAILLVCVVLIFLRGSVVPELEEVETELNARLSVLDKNAINSDQLEAEVEQLEADVASMDARLFDPNQRAINTNFFYSLEEYVDVVVTGVTQLPAEDAVFGKGGPNELSLYNALTYEISLEGSFPQFLTFLHTLHTVEPLIRVADFQLSEAGGADVAAGSLKAKLRVLVLAQKN
jgi:Tfp pilus assembly protein PilO